MRLFRLAIVIAVTLLSTAIDAQQPSTDAAPTAPTIDQATRLALQSACKYDDAMKESDPAKKQALLHAAISCIDSKTKAADAAAKASQYKAKAAHDRILAAENTKLQTRLNALMETAAKDPSVQALNLPPTNAPAPPPKPVDAGAPHQLKTSQITDGASTQESPVFDVGAKAQQSAYSTTSACDSGTSTAARANGQAILSVHRELLRQQDVQDDFGYRLGKRFLVYQVSVTNSSKDFQYSVGDISVDMEKVLSIQGADFKGANAAQHEASGETLEMLRGVPEKGQDYDPRNITLHILQGIGSVGGGVSGLTPFSGTMGSAMANFNGAFLQAFTGISPDHTANQLNRLSDMAFSSNTLIGKLQTRTFAIFIPKTFILTADNAKAFHKDPRTLLNWLPLDQVNVCVDGILLIQAATTADPTFSSDVPNVAPGSTLTLTDTTPNNTIFYTDNGDTPTTASTQYHTGFPLKSTVGDEKHIKAFATAPNLAPSNIVDRTFTTADPATQPTFRLTDGKITINSTTDDSVYYTLDGTTPSVKSTPYSVPFSITPDQKLQAIAIGKTTSYSPVAPYKPTSP